MEINNIDALRKHAIDTLSKLSQGKITTEEAGVTGKLCENVVSTLKIQLEYAKILSQEPTIDFLEDCTVHKGKFIKSIDERKSLPMPSFDKMKRK